MNGLNSQAFHAGVNPLFLLADESSILKDRSCDWSVASRDVGVFYRR